MVAEILGDLVVQVVLVMHLLFLHVHEYDEVAVRLRRALLTKNVESRRNVMLDLGQQLLGSEPLIHVELSIEEFVIGAC